MSLSHTMQHPRQLSILFATTRSELQAAQRLRYRVFAQEMKRAAMASEKVLTSTDSPPIPGTRVANE